MNFEAGHWSSGVTNGSRKVRRGNLWGCLSWTVSPSQSTHTPTPSEDEQPPGETSVHVSIGIYLHGVQKRVHPHKLSTMVGHRSVWEWKKILAPSARNALLVKHSSVFPFYDANESFEGRQ